MTFLHNSELDMSYVYGDVGALLRQLNKRFHTSYAPGPIHECTVDEEYVRVPLHGVSEIASFFDLLTCLRRVYPNADLEECSSTKYESEKWIKLPLSSLISSPLSKKKKDVEKSNICLWCFFPCCFCFYSRRNRRKMASVWFLLILLLLLAIGAAIYFAKNFLLDEQQHQETLLRHGETNASVADEKNDFYNQYYQDVSTTSSEQKETSSPSSSVAKTLLTQAITFFYHAFHKK